MKRKKCYHVRIDSNDEAQGQPYIETEYKHKSDADFVAAVLRELLSISKHTDAGYISVVKCEGEKNTEVKKYIIGATNIRER